MSLKGNSEKTAAIVLGGGLRRVTIGERAWYEPEEQVKTRLDTAYALFVGGKADVIIATGKYGPRAEIDPEVTGPRTEAEVSVAYLIAKANANGSSDTSRGLEDCIVYENQSMDTIGNAWYAKKLCLEPLGITSCIVVTSDYHIERSRFVFEWVLGPRYTVACAAAPSNLSAVERERRDRFEKALTEFMQTRLMSTIAAGDDEAIARFMETEHRRMLLGGGPPPPELAHLGLAPPSNGPG